MYKEVAAALKLKGMTQQELAAELSMASSTLSLKLNGKSPISLTEARRIKSKLGFDRPLEDLLNCSSVRHLAGS